jgi:hypothetical protein
LVINIKNSATTQQLLVINKKNSTLITTYISNKYEKFGSIYIYILVNNIKNSASITQHILVINAKNSA